MDSKDIKLNDWHRILFGESPPAYLLEVVVRVGVVYVLILIAMRLLGKRMTAKVSRAELVARVSLAAAVGLPIQRPNRGLLGPAIIAIIIVAVSRLLSSIAFGSQGFEKAYQGKYAALVADGIIDIKQMRRIRITKERLFAALRSEGVRHLGQVKRFYIEANGEFSLVCAKDERPGLCVIPVWDSELRQRQRLTNDSVCSTCGTVMTSGNDKCVNCKSSAVEKAVLLSTSIDASQKN